MFRPSVPAGWRHAVRLAAARRPSQMWMKNTIAPLDMVFINHDGTIRSIAENTVPREPRHDRQQRPGARHAGTRRRHHGAARHPRRRHGARRHLRPRPVNRGLRRPAPPHSFRAVQRGVAQPGSARVLGTRGRRFESGRPDHGDRFEESSIRCAPASTSSPRTPCSPAARHRRVGLDIAYERAEAQRNDPLMGWWGSGDARSQVSPPVRHARGGDRLRRPQRHPLRRRAAAAAPHQAEGLCRQLQIRPGRELDPLTPGARSPHAQFAPLAQSDRATAF